MRSKLLKFYQFLPVFLQNMLCSLEGGRIIRRRYGGDWQNTLEKTVKNFTMSKADILIYQQNRLKQFFAIANNLDYWSELFKHYQVDINADDVLNEYLKLPILSKAIVRDAPEKFINKNLADVKLYKSHTSGSTGAGLHFPITRSFEQSQWAVWWRYRLKLGIAQDAWCGYFGGRSIVPLAQKKPPFFRVNRPGKQLLFSAYHLNKSTVKNYVDGLVKYRIKWLHGYPSQLYLLAKLAKEQGVSLPVMKFVTVGSENLLDFQRQIIEDQFGCVVHQHYGLAEGVANISECSYRKLHVDEDFSFVEFIPVDGVAGHYHVVGTCWNNPAFILLRYDTGDIVSMSGQTICDCGYEGRIVDSVDGRMEDYVTLPNGVKLGRMDHIFKDMINVKEAQIYQPNTNFLIFKIVKGKEYNLGDEERLMHEIRQRVDGLIEVKISYVKSISRTKSGKLRFVISDVKS